MRLAAISFVVFLGGEVDVGRSSRWHRNSLLNLSQRKRTQAVHQLHESESCGFWFEEEKSSPHLLSWWCFLRDSEAVREVVGEKRRARKSREYIPKREQRRRKDACGHPTFLNTFLSQ